MDRKKTQVPPLRFAPVGMTVSFKVEGFARVNKVTDSPNDTGASGPRFSAAPTALRSSSELIPSPSGLGSRLAAGPPGLASMAILQCHFFLNLPCKLAARDDKGGG